MSQVQTFSQDHLVVRYVAPLDMEECWNEHGSDELILMMGESLHHVVDTALCVRQFLIDTDQEYAKDQLRSWLGVDEASEEHLVDRAMIISEELLRQLSPVVDNPYLQDHIPPGYSDGGYQLERLIGERTVVLRRDFYKRIEPPDPA